ncbi:MAG: ATP-binding protein, partial [Alkalispirochaeta sp.]
MSDEEQFLEFAADDTAAGFRLNRVELYNWGTFHGGVTAFAPEGRNALLTGDIGSGKSTVVDAITALLVPPGRVSFNKAAGASRKERDLRSYVLGYHRSQRDVEDAPARPVALRDGRSLSVILAVFTNIGYGQTVTVAQILKMKDGRGQPDRIYLVAQRALSIADDILTAGTDLTALRAGLRTLEDTDPPYRTYAEYAGAFRRRLGLKSEQALLLFHQTISMKSVGNLTAFVREHMLEPFDVAPRVEALVAHFEDLHRAHEAVLTAKEQIRRLTEIESHVASFRTEKERVDRLVFARDGLDAYFAERRSELLRDRIVERERELERLRRRVEHARERLRSEQTQRDEVVAAISEAGGDRLSGLQRERDALAAERDRRSRGAEDYRTLATRFSLPDPTDLDTFSTNLERIVELTAEAEHELTTANETLSEAGGNVRDLKGRHDELAGEIVSLEGRRSNIPARQIAIRDELCRAIGVSTGEIPFVGELIEVREEEREWEGAIERVLRGFGLSLLVPPEHYVAVSDWVDRTHLGGRLTYYRVHPDSEPSWEVVSDEATLVEKIALKPDSPHRDWLEGQIRKRFGYRCAETIEEFRRAPRGITRNGQIKGHGHHEKDDRHRIDDRSRYILGWRNDEKLRHLRAVLADLETETGRAAEAYSAAQRRQQEILARRNDLAVLAARREFTDIDWRTPALAIEGVDAEIAELTAASDVLETLTRRRETIEEQITATTNEIERLQGETSRLDERRRNDNALLAEDDETVATAPAPMEEIRIAVGEVSREIETAGELPAVKLTVENTGKRTSEVRGRIQAWADAAIKRMRRAEEAATREMLDFSREYPAETQEIDASIDGSAEYLAMLERLRRDDLPQFEARFKALLNENTIREIANFQAQLNKESELIRDRIATINRSLHDIDYEEGRYIRLEAQLAADQEIRRFRQDLKSCTSGAIGADDDDRYGEHKFDQVKRIIDRFRGREGSAEVDARWTEKVTDVRAWFTFAASVRWREDDSEYEHHSDSDGKSGGQKEKLAYTVLAASVAYQFGLEWGETRSRSFRCVVIDEAFGKGSDESARFALDLFRRLNLQLLMVTPLTKLPVIEPHVSTVGFVANLAGNRSVLRSFT